MKIQSITIKNFRAFEEVSFDCRDLVSLVGANGAGKSTVLAALNVFFRRSDDVSTDLLNLVDEDFHQKNISDPIEITVTFSDLSDDATEEFQSYVRHGQLAITASAWFDHELGAASVKQFGERLVMPELAEYFEKEKEGASAAELKGIFANLQQTFPDISDASTKAQMKSSLQEYESKHEDKCTLQRSQDNFYGFTRGSDKLERYINWVYVPAVKDATAEGLESRNSALGQLLNIAIRSEVDFSKAIDEIRQEARNKYQSLIQSEQKVLGDLSAALSDRLSGFTNSDSRAELVWIEDEKRSVQIADPAAKVLASEGSFKGDIARFGHGYQRCYLLALLQEIASRSLSTSPTLILGIEEPELYQHPPQARHLSEVLRKIGDGNAQVFVTTHSPHFVYGRHFENVYLAQREAGKERSQINNCSVEEISARLNEVYSEKVLSPTAQSARIDQALNPKINELFFCSHAIFVEGIEDEAYLTTWLILNDFWDDFRKSGAHIVPTSKKSNLIRPLVLCDKLGRGAFAVFDADGDDENPKRREFHERDNLRILNALNVDNPVSFPTEAVFGANYIQWPYDLKKQVAGDVEPALWDKCFQRARTILGNPIEDFSKNPMFIAEFLTALRKEQQAVSPLDRMCEAVLSFVS